MDEVEPGLAFPASQDPALFASLIMNVPERGRRSNPQS
jgi:hypothetical protein